MTGDSPHRPGVLAEVNAERDRQTQLWPHDEGHSLGAWHAIINGRTGKLAEASLGTGLYDSVPCLRDDDEVSAIHTAAVELAAAAVALAEQTASRLDT